MTDEEEAGASFAFVAGTRGDLRLGDMWATFGDTAMSSAEKRARFHEAIAAVKLALDAYEPLAGLIELDDQRLVDASAEIHRTLSLVNFEHFRIAGGAFPQPRGERAIDWDALDAEDPESEPDETDATAPVPPVEFGAVVPLDIELASDFGTFHIRSAIAYTTGVILSVDGFLKRASENRRTWRERSAEFMSFRADGMTLVIDDHPAHQHGGSASGGDRFARREQEYWVPGPFDRDILRGEFRPTEGHGLTFVLDARMLREAQSRARPL